MTENNRQSVTELAQTVQKPQDMMFPPHQTDLGNAKNLVLARGSTLRYCYPKKTWYIWDGVRWKPDDVGLIHRRAQETVHLMFAKAGKGQPSIDKKAAKHAMRSESRRALEAMVAIAQSQPGIPVLPSELDADPWQLNVQNGSLNLRTSELYRHEKRDLVTKLAPVTYDPEATCPQWTRFLNEILAGNEQLIAFLKRAVGYTLTGDTSEHVLFFLYGTGANGKTTFLRSLQGVFGDYACQADPDLLLKTYTPQHPTNIARLEKVRLTICMEVEEGRSMRTSLMKQLTGGDKRTARQMRQDFREYEPTDKIWLGANNKPRIRGQELAIWRRIKLIPFTMTIPEEKQDKHLAEKLIGEAPGILNWALEGCQEWQEQKGLDEPEDVKDAVEDYKSESDPLHEFIQEYCVIGAEKKSTSAGFYQGYKSWAIKEGLKQREILSHNAFSRELAGRFEKCKVKVKRDGKLKYQRGYKGIGLRKIEEIGDSYENSQAQSPF